MKTYLDSIIQRFRSYKEMSEKVFAQLKDEDLFWQYNNESNSIVIIVQHMAGNMISRWTDFLTADGEKEWRNRDEEFEHVITSRQQLLDKWNEGWACTFNALNALSSSDMEHTVYVRNEALTVVDAINRQLAHQAYHVGQIVFIGKMLTGPKWDSLSIPKGQSRAFNAQMFSAGTLASQNLTGSEELKTQTKVSPTGGDLEGAQ